ncbi:hypothetical protein OB947_16355 [Aeromonas bestiarum]|uniref:hypothetical protein n=1 Tax=Aeromonas bestiarum TaxID=105751 RepID=UPI00259EAC15|nr:hypothetical protein [Aeromonas bestiarum]MDM5090451.1 hypothetical protein [Aeromonas bestiarum]
MRLLYLLVLFASFTVGANTDDTMMVCDGLITKAKTYSTMPPATLKKLRDAAMEATLEDFRQEYGSAVDDAVTQLLATNLSREQVQFQVLRQLRIFQGMLINMGLNLNGVEDPAPWEKFRQDCIASNGQWPAM